eukprot:8251175-Alexandrium_andersonii.AAC.1
MKDCLKSSGLWQLMLLMLIVFNVESGPFKEDLRFAQVAQAWQELKDNHDCKSCPLFQEYAPKIMEEMVAAGAFQHERGEDCEAALWSK